MTTSVVVLRDPMGTLAEDTTAWTSIRLGEARKCRREL